MLLMLFTMTEMKMMKIWMIINLKSKKDLIERSLGMNKKFKNGVSNWTFKFDNDEEVFLNTVRGEVITYNSDGTTEIIIYEASIINELLQLFREGNKVKQIIQNLLIITDADERMEENWIYDNMEIKNVIITSQYDAISEFSVVLRNY